MMEDHEFCDDCPGCRPAMADVKTGEVLGNNTPTMQIVNRIWDNETTYAERKAFIEVTLHNFRQPHELRLAQKVMSQIQVALQEDDSGSRN